MRRAALLCLVSFASFASGPARADVSVTDLQITARALTFMESPPSGNVRVGIIYNPTNTSTRRQARELEQMLRGGLRVGNINLEPRMVSIDQAASAGVDLFFLTENLGEAGRKVAGLGKTRRIPCVTTDLAQVRDGACAVGIRSTPKVEILVNRDAANSSGMTFAAAFRMMISEI